MNTQTPHIRLVIFDLAGTTVDFGSMAPVVAFAELFAREGVSVTPAEIRAFMGMHKRDHIRELLRLAAVASRWRAARKTDWTESDLDRMYTAFQPLQIDALAMHSELIPGTLQTVAWLRRLDIRVAATTGYNRAMTAVVAREAQKQGFLPDVILCGDDAPGRPSPWMAVGCCQRLGIYPFCTVAKVGDTPMDISEGKNAGMWTAGVTLTGNEFGISAAEFAAMKPEDLQARRAAAATIFQTAGAHEVLDSISDVPEWIEKLNAKLAANEKPD